jgi:hypothetical protein
VTPVRVLVALDRGVSWHLALGATIGLAGTGEVAVTGFFVEDACARPACD